MTDPRSEGTRERWEVRRVLALNGGTELYRGNHAYAVFWWHKDALDLRDMLNATLAAPELPEQETMAAAVHQAYLDTCERLGWPVKPENQVSYEALSEDSKELDRASVRAVLAFVPTPPDGQATLLVDFVQRENFCDEHGPQGRTAGGTRGYCQPCAVFELSAAIDEIDCLLTDEETVRHGANDYAVFCDERAVVEKVRARLDAAQQGGSQ